MLLSPSCRAELMMFGARAVVTLHGGLDLASTAWLRDYLDGVLLLNPRVVTVDLAALECCDSSGIAVFAEYRRRAEHEGRTLWLRAPSPALRHLLELTALTDLLDDAH